VGWAVGFQEGVKDDDGQVKWPKHVVDTLYTNR